MSSAMSLARASEDVADGNLCQQQKGLTRIDTDDTDSKTMTTNDDIY
jgi:hypothetical protein